MTREPGKKPLIWIVDDDELVGASVCMILQYSRMECVHFDDPVEALRCAEKEQPNRLPQVVISDFSMGPMNGAQFITAWRARFPQTKIMLFSAHSFDPEIQMLATPPDVIETKPSSVKRIVELVNQLLEEPRL